MTTTLGQLRVRCLKHPLGAGTDRVLLDGAINDAMEEIVERYDWTRLIVEGSLQTVAIYETGTLALTNGSTAVTGTGTTFTTAMTGRKLRVVGRNESYTFTRTGDTTGTLDRVYEGETNDELSYKIFQNVYETGATVERVESLRHPRAQRDLDQVSREYLDDIDPARILQGDPCRFTTYSDSDDSPAITQIELHPIPERAEGLPIRYRVKVSKLTAASDAIPEWMSERAVFYGALCGLATISGADGRGYELKFEKALAGMVKQDVLATETEPLRMADQYVRHRAARGYEDGDEPINWGDPWS